MIEKLMINFFKKTISKMLPWRDESAKIMSLYLKAHKKYVKGRTHCADYYAYKISKRYRCYIHPSAKIGARCFLPHPVDIVIGAGVSIGVDAVIYQGVTLGRKYMDKADYPTIGNNVTLYANVVVVGGVKIDDGAVVGCNSVVLKNVGQKEVVSGIVK